MNKGRISQIIGPVLDVEFEEGKLPAIYHAITVKRTDGSDLVAEVHQHLGENMVRAVAMDSTDGLTRGMMCWIPAPPFPFRLARKPWVV